MSETEPLKITIYFDSILLGKLRVLCDQEWEHLEEIQSSHAKGSPY